MTSDERAAAGTEAEAGAGAEAEQVEAVAVVGANGAGVDADEAVGGVIAAGERACVGIVCTSAAHSDGAGVREVTGWATKDVGSQ